MDDSRSFGDEIRLMIVVPACWDVDEVRFSYAPRKLFKGCSRFSELFSTQQEDLVLELTYLLNS